MSFFVLSNSNLTEITFDYILSPGGNRLDPTLSPESKKSDHTKKEQSQRTYAIEIMSTPVIALDHKALTKEAINLLNKEKIHHIILTKNDEVKGLVSDRDLSWQRKLELDIDAPIENFMSSMILACHEETPIDHISRVMVHEHISVIPVINNQKKLVGIVTHHDLLKWIFN
jgi:CBS domain-containing protein